jgi:hypothetical protein
MRVYVTGDSISEKIVSLHINIKLERKRHHAGAV